MASPLSRTRGGRPDSWIALVLCAAVAVGRAIELRLSVPATPLVSAPIWLPLAALACAATDLVRADGSSPWHRVQRASRWIAVLLMAWAANGLPFDILTMAGLMGQRTASGDIVIATVNWPRLLTRATALAATIVLARLALERQAGHAATRPATWYGYAAFVLALPYPVFRIVWALGGSLGAGRPGAGGEGYAPLLLALPWVAAAVLSLLLVRPRRWLPRRLILFAGWSATAIVGLIGPVAVWVFVSAIATAESPGAAVPPGARAPEIARWVFALFYGSWFLWAFVAGAATRSYQVRSAAPAAGVGEAHAGA